MSLSWLERLTLFVHPYRIVLERQRWRGALTRQQINVKPAAAGAADWQAALAAASTLLDSRDRRAGPGARLRIIVADHFVRYALLPWSDLLLTPKARQAMALALLRNALGDQAKALEIAVDRPVFGRSGVAAGVDRQLLDALRAAVRAQRWRLTSVQPRLIAELAQQPLNDGWFAGLDRDWLTLAGVRGGALVCLHNHRAATSDAALRSGELARLLAGLLAAEATAVAGKTLCLCSRELGPLAATLVPTLAAGWETTLWPAVVPGDADA